MVSRERVATGQPCSLRCRIFPIQIYRISYIKLRLLIETSEPLISTRSFQGKLQVCACRHARPLDEVIIRCTLPKYTPNNAGYLDMPPGRKLWGPAFACQDYKQGPKVHRVCRTLDR
jgi:hypothetical protein